MDRFTLDEMYLISIYLTNDRQETIAAMEEMALYLEEDEEDLRRLTYDTIGKLHQMTDTDFDTLDLQALPYLL